MVSPSKYCRTPNSDFKIGIERSKKDVSKNQGASKHFKSSSSLSTNNYQPLVNKTFYLDIRNKTELNKVESSLKSYGARIELFLVKQVNIVVTDRTEWVGNGQSPAASVSPLTTPSPSTHSDQLRSVPRSRASAMLEKVSRQPSFPYNCPLELAQKWRIPILSIPGIWKYIAKVKDSIISKVNAKKIKDKKNKSHIVIDANDSAFVKVESLFSPDKPEFEVFDHWPRLSLDGHLGQCPFRSSSRPASSQPEEPQKVANEVFEVNEGKNKVTVEVIKYDDFRIRDVKEWKCEEEERERKRRRFERKGEVEHFPIKVQCNGLTTGLRNSKLLSPSGSDVLPLPSSRRSTRRTSASWCGSTRELSQLSPTDSEIENVRRSESGFDAHDPALDSPGITLRPKGQLWLPIALIGTTAEENGNSIRKRYDCAGKNSENAKFSNDLLDSQKNDSCMNQFCSKVSKGSDSSLNSSSSYQNEYQIKKNGDKKETYCIITRNTKIKNDEMNGKSRESSVDSHKSVQERPKSRVDGKKRSLSACGAVLPKRSRTTSTNSVSSVGRKKKLSPEEKLLQDNKEYFKMEVLNTKLRSSGSLLNLNCNKEPETNGDDKPEEKIDKIIIKKIKVKGKKKNKWTKNDSDYAAIIIDKKKNNVKLNGIIRKKRQSELMKLCDEAESFMFGESSRQGSTTTTVESEQEDSPVKKKSTSRKNYDDDTQSSDGKRRKKRRSHAEAFIHDNIDYYKFETPGSRLRYQGSLLDVKSEDKDFVYTLKQKKKTESEKVAEIKEEIPETELIPLPEKKRNCFHTSEEVENLLFSFESIPITEPWYDVYKRQDEGMENYHPLLSDPNDEPFLLPYELPKPVYSKISDASEYYKRRRKRLAHLLANHPRKSPRCHASTLAILSSLKKRKRRSGTNISMASTVPETSQQPEEQPKKEVPECERILEFLDESESEDEGVFLEPSSDSECRKRKSSDSREEDRQRVGSRSRKRIESNNEADDKRFVLQCVEPDEFFKDMTIDKTKKSCLIINIVSALANAKKMDDPEVDLISEIDGNSVTDEVNLKRRRRKARKINKTGWDNKKTRRKLGGKKIPDGKTKSESVSKMTPKRIKNKVKLRKKGINAENIMSSKMRLRGKKSKQDRPVLRSQVEDRVGALRRSSRESEDHSRSESLDSGSLDFSSCVVGVKKIPVKKKKAPVRARTSKGRYLPNRRIILSKKKRRVVDYAWTTKKR